MFLEGTRKPVGDMQEFEIQESHPTLSHDVTAGPFLLLQSENVLYSLKKFKTFPEFHQC